MFKSYNFLRYNELTKRNIYKIIDDNFEETIELTSYTLLCDAAIEVYSRRNLSVAPNVIRYMLWYRDQTHSSLDIIYKHLKCYTKHWSKIDKEIKKYLLFS